MPLLHGRLMAWAALMIILAAAMITSTAEATQRSRHRHLDPLTTSDSRLSAAGKQKHLLKFHKGLTAYADHLENASDLMLLQVESLDQHENQDTSDGEGELDSMHEEHSGVNLEQELHNFWSQGDPRAVAHILELKHGVTLDDRQRTSLVGQLEKTMKLVADGVDHGETVNPIQLTQTLDSMLGEVVFPVEKSMLEHQSEGNEGSDAGAGELSEEWIANTLAHAQKSLTNESSTLYQDLMDAATTHVEKTDERVLRYTQPLEATMNRILSQAMTKIDDKDSTLGAELRFAAKEFAEKNDPSVQAASAILANPAALVAEVNAAQTAATTTTEPEVDMNADWIKNLLAGAITDIDNGQGELSTQLQDAAEIHAMTNPEPSQSTESLAQEIFSNINEDELEAHLRFTARKKVFEDVVDLNKKKCEERRKRGLECDMQQFLSDTAKGLKSILKNKVPEALENAKADRALGAKATLEISRSASSTPESVRDVELSIKNGVDPWGDLKGRQTKALHVKEKYVIDLLDGDAERCPKKCSLHGQCLMDLNSTVKSGSTNVHPFHCICDTGYVGNACQIKLDMHLRWLLTEGAAPFPKCCKVCESQREVPLKWDDIPTYNNPFASFAPECQPYPRISMYSREDGSHELIKDRRPDPKCSHPLGEITHADPIVALELATDLSAAQGILESSLLTDMALLSTDASHMARMTAEHRTQHRARLTHAARTLKEASETAKKAAAALAQKLRIPDLETIKYSSIDLDGLLEDYREMPNEMEECCLFCQLDKDPETFMANSSPAANVGPNAILNQDPREDNAIDAQHRRMAKKRADRRHAQLSGTTPKADQDCCVVCPYNFRELERLEEAAHIRKHTPADEDQEEKDKVFLEVFASVEGDRRRRHEPMPCCPACPSQFLIAHAFPSNPWTTTRTLPNTGPQ